MHKQSQTHLNISALVSYMDGYIKYDNASPEEVSSALGTTATRQSTARELHTKSHTRYIQNKDISYNFMLEMHIS